MQQGEKTMNRLTYPGDYCKDIAYCGNHCSNSCRSRQLWERLKAYEDTGLSPEDVRRMTHGNTEKL